MATIILKKYFVPNPMSAFPNFDKQILVGTDASKIAVGAVLTQNNEDGKFHLIQFVGRTVIRNILEGSTSSGISLNIVRFIVLSSHPSKLVMDQNTHRFTLRRSMYMGAWYLGWISLSRKTLKSSLKRGSRMMQQNTCPEKRRVT